MIFAFLPTSLVAAHLHVSPVGDDANPGTIDAPLRSLAAARDAARAHVGKGAVTIHVADGVYHLPETLVLTPADSGSVNHPVIYQAVNDGKAVISGGAPLALQWRPYRDGIQQASTPAGLTIDQLFVNGIRQHMARYPNHDSTKPTAAYQGFAADAFSKERAAKWKNPAGGFIHAMHVHRWGGYHYRITGKNLDGSVAYEGGWQNNRQMGMHKEYRMVENIFEELDAPGEWFHNSETRTLYFMPQPATDPASVTVEVVRLPCLVEFLGSMESPVKHLTFKAFVFRHTARTFMETKEPLLRSDWTIHRGGTVLLTGTEHVSILDCEFDQPGGNAVFVNHYNRHALIRGCHIHNAGASGVCFVGDPKAVRDPLFEYAQTRNLAGIDHNPGPQTDNHPADCAVEDCLIHGIGRVERQPAGVQISMSRRIAVRDTSIYDCARAGINVGDGCWGGHLIERCDVFDTVLETHDHGAFNSWGRDRYWSPNHRIISEPAVKENPSLPFLDAVEPIVIRNNRWRCDHGWDIDLDDGSSNYRIYNNLMLAGGLKLREGYRREVFNNILVNSGLRPHVWFDASDSSFQRNIVMTAHAPVRQPDGWGKSVDHNLFMTKSDRDRHRNSGADARSLAGDPQFLNPGAGDFRVAEGSPALQVGFKNFPMDQFGVKKPSLRAIARTPEIPALKLGWKGSGEPAALPLFWLGAPLHSLQGDEFSAFGVSREDMGVQIVDVPTGSHAAAAGLLAGDIVQQVNGRKVSHTDSLFAAIIAAGPAPIEIRLIRNQQPVILRIGSAPYVVVESAKSAGNLKFRPQAISPARTITSRPKTGRKQVALLTDGALGAGKGLAFPSGVTNGAYMMDLGSEQSVTTVASWSFGNKPHGSRQIATLYGSRSKTNPGWNIADRTKFTPLGSLDTASVNGAGFTTAALRAPVGSTLGSFRWIIWQTAPVSKLGDNTTFQELAVETTR